MSKRIFRLVVATFISAIGIAAGEASSAHSLLLEFLHS